MNYNQRRRLTTATARPTATQGKAAELGCALIRTASRGGPSGDRQRFWGIRHSRVDCTDLPSPLPEQPEPQELRFRGQDVVPGNP
jgi:hypothetical protein